MKNLPLYEKVQVSNDGKGWHQAILIATIKNASYPYVCVYPDHMNEINFLTGKEFYTFSYSLAKPISKSYDAKAIELFIEYPFKNPNHDGKVLVCCKVSGVEDLKDMDYSQFYIKQEIKGEIQDITRAFEALGVFEKVVDEIQQSSWYEEFDKYKDLFQNLID